MGARRALVLLAAVLVTLLGCARTSSRETSLERLPRSDVLELKGWLLHVEGAPPQPIVLPAHLDAQVRGKPRYRITTTVDLPPSMRGEELTLAIPFLPARANLTLVSPTERVRATRLDIDDFERYRSAGPQRFRITKADSASGRLELELEAEHLWTQSAWLDSIPRISVGESGDRTFRFVRDFDRITAAIALGTALLSGLSYGTIYLFDRRRVAHGWFGIEALAVAFYPAFHLSLTQPIFGRYEVALLGPLVCLAILSAVHFTRAQFGFAPPHRAWDLAWVACAAMALIFHDPFSSTQVLGGYVSLFAIACIGHMLFLHAGVIQTSENRISAIGGMITWSLLLILGGVDFAAWLSLGEALGGVRGACLGIALIAVLQSLTFSLDHLSSLQREHALAVERAVRIGELEVTNREVKTLNEELRRQVAARSQALADAIARLGAPRARTTELAVGEVVDDRYRIVRSIGAGGMGKVYEVERTSDGRPFALKVLTVLGSSTAMARFAREAQIASTVSHPNVVALVDVDVSAGGFFFLVMELLQGHPLSKERARYGDVRWAVAVLKQLSDGLGAIHDRGVVHRDLKPSNVLLTREAGEGDVPLVKIADFGISSLDPSRDTTSSGAREKPVSLADTDREEDDDDQDRTRRERRPPRVQSGSELTLTGVIMGTPRYMAPELATGARDARAPSDVFSLGVMAFEMLTNQFPFPNAQAPGHAAMEGRAVVEPRKVQEVAPNVPAVLAELVDQMLSLDPAARPFTSEIIERLRALEAVA